MKRKAPTGATRRVRRRIARRRKLYARRVPRAPRPRVASMMVKRTNYSGNWTFGTTTTADFWRYVSFDMTAFNQFTEFASVFDEYRVNAIKVTFRPAYDTVFVDTVGVQAYAHFVVDPASTLVPSGTYTSANLNTFLQNDKVRTRILNKPFSIYWKPKVLDQVATTGTASCIRSSPWVRTSDTGPGYRGFHMFLQQNNMATSNTMVKLDQFVTFYVSFRNLR